MRCSALAVFAIASVASATPREPTPAELAWPATTRSLEAKQVTEVVRQPSSRERVGKLARGTRVAWKRLVAGGNGCRAYAEIEPRGWVCTSALAPSDEPAAAAIDTARLVDRVLAETYLHVGPEGARAYDSTAAIARERPSRKLPGWRFLHSAIRDLGVVNGYVFVKTVDGYVATRELLAKPPSPWTGLALPADQPLGFGWTVSREELAVVRAAPSPTAARVRELAGRTRVPILERRDGHARIAAAEWVALSELNIAAVAARPKGVKADERWIDVDLDEQTLVAYEGDTPVFATVVSTGRGTSTPASLHRIRSKRMLIDLVAPKESFGSWNMPDTPFYMDFRRYYALHGVYWHDMFGRKRSHGCVNLSPRDAGWLFDWTLPNVPAGWLESAARGSEGTPIRIRSRAVPDPPWTDYNAPPPVRLREQPTPAS